MTRPRARHIKEAAKPQGRVVAVALGIVVLWLTISTLIH
jgi:hypothetical protein